MSSIYEIRDITFTYPSLDRTVLDHVSVDIAEGDVVTILGRNGAGKSTLLGCMLGLKRPRDGEILLSGRSLRGMSEREIATVVGYVPQSHAPAFEHTVFDFVQMGCASRISLFSRPGQREREDTAAVLTELGIAQLADRPYSRLSGGEQQQAIIARAIVTRPRIILFDEPTAHLDFGNQVRTLRLVRQFADKGFAVVITSHNPDHAILLGGRTALLDSNGHLQSGKTEDIVTEDALRAIYGADLRLEYSAALGRRLCAYPNL